jgi:hypothetical protein
VNLTLHLTADTEARLRQQAALAGKSLEALALEALEAKLEEGDDPSVMLAADTWNAKFDEFLANLPRTAATFVDDSRESIYEGRGE